MSPEFLSCGRNHLVHSRGGRAVSEAKNQKIKTSLIIPHRLDSPAFLIALQSPWEEYPNVGRSYAQSPSGKPDRNLTLNQNRPPKFPRRVSCRVVLASKYIYLCQALFLICPLPGKPAGRRTSGSCWKAGGSLPECF